MKNQLIRSVVRKHQELARLILVFGISESNVQDINLLKIISSIDGEKDLINKGIYIKGVNILLSIQCNIILNDLNLLQLPGGLKIPKSKTKRTRTVTTVIKTVEGKEPKKQLIAYNNNNTIRTPIPINGYNNNKSIMGLTIYSQYEFDINNNIISQRLGICKYNRANSTDEDKITNSVKDRKIKKSVKGNKNVKLHLILIKKYNSYLSNKFKTSRDLEPKQPSNNIPGKSNGASAAELCNKVANGNVIKRKDENKYADDIMKTIETKGFCEFDELFPRSRGRLVTSQYFLNLLVLLNDNKLQMAVINNELRLSIAS